MIIAFLLFLSVLSVYLVLVLLSGYSLQHMTAVCGSASELVHSPNLAIEAIFLEAKIAVSRTYRGINDFDCLNI